MNEYRYILQPYNGIRSRYTCPACNHKHKFTRYIDITTGKQIADHVGRCDRENSCGYHCSPKQFFADNPRSSESFSNWQPPEPESNIYHTIDYLPFDVFEKSMVRHERCNLYPFLIRLFREDVAKKLCDNFFIGANKEGNTVFWQVDITGKIRQAKVMEYDSSTGKRNKSKGAFFAGKKILGNNDVTLNQCFFGEYLLSFPENESKVVAIVESEKTAVIASVYYPDFIWLATGGKNGCKWTEKNVCNVLTGKKVILFPDLGAYNNWKDKGQLLSNVAGCNVVVSDYIELNAVEMEHKEGLDIVDYLLRARDTSGLALTDYYYPIIFDSKY